MSCGVLNLLLNNYFIKYKVNYNLYIDKYNNSVLKIVNNRVTILNRLLENICIYDLNTIYNNIETILEYNTGAAFTNRITSISGLLVGTGLKEASICIEKYAKATIPIPAIIMMIFLLFILLPI